MNFLELVRDLYKESGESFSGGATATSADSSAVSYDALVAGWIKAAWQDVQMAQRQWRWMWSEWNLATVDQDTLLPTPSTRRSAIQRIDHEAGVTIEPTGSATDFRYLEFVRYDGNEAFFRHKPAGRPQFYTILPNGKLRLERVPDQSYTLRGEGWCTPWDLTANADEPDMPSRFHKLIVYTALLDHARWEASPEQLQIAVEEKRRLYNRLVDDQAPAPNLAGVALA